MRKKPMRVADIPLENAPVNMRTEELYLPDRRNTPLSARPDHELALGLCYKCGGKIEVCAECPGKCTFGRLLLKRREAEEACATRTRTGS